MVQCFTRTLLLDTAGAVLATATNWDEIEIQEETESGNSVTSKIRLPVQVEMSSVNTEKQSAGRRKALVSKTTALSNGADLLWSLLDVMSRGQTLSGVLICSLRYSPLKDRGQRKEIR